MTILTITQVISKRNMSLEEKKGYTCGHNSCAAKGGKNLN